MGDWVERMLRTSTVLLVLVLPARVWAQAIPAAPPTDVATCLGFAFSKWTPALDWKGAGHGAMPDSSRVPHAPGGRDWAADALDRASDSTLVLFPTWWPVGVIITFDRKPAVVGDTVTGRAYAMVADGTRTPPRASVRAWLKACT
jgi:hypothetical protein